MSDRVPLYHQVVLTAGVSVFNLRNVFGAWSREAGIFAFKGITPSPAAGLDPEPCLGAWDERCRRVNLGPARQQPEDVSAEVSLLHALHKRGRLGRAPTVTLILTDTFAGRAAGALVRRCVERMFDATVGCKYIADIAVDEPERLRRSLGAMMGEVAQSLEGGDPSITCFAPVGGYKIITSLGYLVGAYLNFPTAYLHEDNQILHEIPAVPIRVSPADLGPALPLMRRGRYAPMPLEPLSDQERRVLDRFTFLFEQSDDLADLTAFGRFLADRPEFLAHTRPVVRATPEVAELLKGGHGPFVAQQLSGLVDKLAHPTSLRGELRHDVAFDVLKGARYRLYKGAVNGTPVFYAAYDYREGEGELRVRSVWLHHDTYIHDAQGGLGFFDPPAALAWSDVTARIWAAE
jgi:hypothetical protein